MLNLLLDAIVPGKSVNHPKALIVFILILVVIAVVTAIITKRKKYLLQVIQKLELISMKFMKKIKNFIVIGLHQIN